MEQLFLVIATGFYSGTLPLAAGVWGALLALFLWYFCRNLSLSVYSAILAGLFLIGCLAATSAEKTFAQLDARPIVIDEILGVFIALTAAPKYRFSWLLGFMLFLILDGLKPFPASWIEMHISGGLGIMLDDAVAGVYALLFLQLTGYILIKNE